MPSLGLRPWVRSAPWRVGKKVIVCCPYSFRVFVSLYMLYVVRPRAGAPRRHVSDMSWTCPGHTSTETPEWPVKMMPHTDAFLQRATTSLSATAIIGDVRVTAISPALVRVEPKGPAALRTGPLSWRSHATSPRRCRFASLRPAAAHSLAPPLTASSSETRRLWRPTMPCATGAVVYDSASPVAATKSNLLYWPSPLAASGYAL